MATRFGGRGVSEDRGRAGGVVMVKSIRVASGQAGEEERDISPDKRLGGSVAMKTEKQGSSWSGVWNQGDGGSCFLKGTISQHFYADGNSAISKGETEDAGKRVGRMGCFWAHGEASAHFQ